jgi:hypothetical protein
VKSTSTKSLSLILAIEVEHVVLPAMDGLPEQIEITSVGLDVVGPTGKTRRVELLHSLDEGTLIQLEDDIVGL